MNKVLRFCVVASTVFLLCLASAVASPAQTFTSLVSFNGTDGTNPAYMSLVQGPDGNLYGTTSQGGANSYGTVFTVTSTGTLTTLYSFDSTDGANPFATLVPAEDGSFYGTTYNGGVSNRGTVFKITPSGTLTTLHSFDFADGAQPSSTLVQATDGNFYGTTEGGGPNNSCQNNCGTIFKINPAGTLTTFYSFCAQTGCPDGAIPVYVVQATDGNFYGTTAQGGAHDAGTVFKITPGGTLTTLLSFDNTDGANPSGGLIQATDGNFYGTTFSGGTNNVGTVYKITSGGTLTTLLSFDSTDGANPAAGLVQGTNGNFYGTTTSGGAKGYGTVFNITAGGTLTTLHSFDLTDGSFPYGGLVQATNGNFYGTTQNGGANNDGTVFSLSVGLGPFVEALPTLGKVGAKIIILGNGLTGATSVTFNGTAATFTVVSSTEIKTTVPTGATTGKVQVTTPHGTLTSNVVFRVK